VGRQWLGRYGKTDNGIVTVTTVWADERLYYPLHAQPYTPASHFPRKQADPGFRTKLQIAADLIAEAIAAGVTCRAVVADSFYGEHDDLRGALRQSGLGFVMALKPSRGTWQYGAEAYTPKDAARAVAWGGPDDPGGWHPSREPSATDTPRPGGRPTPNSPGGDRRTHPPRGRHHRPANPAGQGHLVPGHEPAPPRRPARHSRRHPPAGGPDRSRAPLRDRHWIEQSYKQVKDELGWADFQVRSATAIRRHQTLVNCAFSFCWDTWFDQRSY
jgi:hypothetical protein